MMHYLLEQAPITQISSWKMLMKHVILIKTISDLFKNLILLTNAVQNS